ncbi:hypothetical protein KL86PLE_40234 [uncultured Pleomorphomonas sp.]|uniref:Uncharacterized protein n=1 Tax=uncultured Pleomorphomonas sp. TaxID=442121 RepID=A0A212LGB6_9HYPH|nr:hypothetical protein KL86PLE_40234 [uncultured Pleomorphomonas sp.]
MISVMTAQFAELDAHDLYVFLPIRTRRLLR